MIATGCFHTVGDLCNYETKYDITKMNFKGANEVAEVHNCSSVLESVHDQTPEIHLHLIYNELNAVT